jgi:uncharacterized membrane protein YphA (DoxX/SURF4 family)
MIAAITCDPLVDLVVRAGLATMFASAAWHKLRDPAAFRAVLEAYRIVPRALLAAAPAVAVFEVALAAALLTPPGRAAGAFGSAAVLALYGAAIAFNLAAGRRHIDCGCGAPGTHQPLSEWLLGRNALLALAALATAAPPASRPLLWVDWLALAGMLAVLSAAWVAGHRLLAASFRTASAGAAR